MNEHPCPFDSILHLKKRFVKKKIKNLVELCRNGNKKVKSETDKTNLVWNATKH